MSLNVSAIFPANPVQLLGRRTEKSPSRMVLRLARITLRSAGIASLARAVAPFVLRLERTSGPADAFSGSVLFILASCLTYQPTRQWSFPCPRAKIRTQAASGLPTRRLLHSNIQ